MSDRGAEQSSRFTASAIVFRLACILVIVILGTWAAHALKEALDLQVIPENERQVHRIVMSGAVAYIALLSMPFVPGAEIGIAMLTAFGAAIAPLVYGCTVLAMCLSYTLGRLLPDRALFWLLDTLRMRKAAALVRRAAPLSQEDRMALLLEGAPPRTVGRVLRYRYIVLGLAVNVPGNAVIGGGGGIALMAGMSGLFAPLPYLLTVAIAVSPVPLVIMFLGL